MKRLTLVVCLFIIPLTLASDTQHRFKVCVRVDGDDSQGVAIIESHLKRELRLLGDVDIVGINDDWVYIFEIFSTALENTDGSKSGKYAIAKYNSFRLAKAFYILPDDYENFAAVPIIGINLGASYYSEDNLREYCIVAAGKFEESFLHAARRVHK